MTTATATSQFGPVTIKRPVLGFAVTLIIGLIFLYGLPLLPNLNIGNTYGDMVTKLPTDIGARIEWAIGDWGDAQFYKSWIGGLFLILGAFAAYFLEKSGSKLKGFGISYGTGLFLSVIAAEILADIISNVLYIPLIWLDPVAAKAGWIPTFIPVCSFAAGAVLSFGGDWKKVLTAAVFGGVIGCPGSWFICKYLAIPFGMPVAIGNVGVMVIGSILIHETFRYLPWMKKQTIGPEPVAAPAPAPTGPVKLNHEGCNQDLLFVRRVLADLNECSFFGSEVASIFMIVGLVIHFMLNTKNPAYGTGLLGAVLAVQFFASGIGLFMYWPLFKEKGWIATFVPVVTLGPVAVMFYGASLYVVVVAGIFGGLFGAPIALYISSRLPRDWPGYTGAVSSMLIITLVFVAVFQIMPWFGLPGLW